MGICISTNNKYDDRGVKSRMVRAVREVIRRGRNCSI